MNNINYTSSPYIAPIKINYKRSQYTDINFTGHFGVENFAGNSLGCLIHETGFFRDIKTKFAVKEYIKKNFRDKNSVKLLVGGCSTGEESLTYSMLLNDIGKYVDILGIDISLPVIKQAKSRKFLMQKMDKIPDRYIDMSYYFEDTLKDSFLVFDEGRRLSEKERALKKYFDDYFEISEEQPVLPKQKLRTQIYNWLLKKFLRIYVPNFKSKYVVLKEGKGNNCRFETGDILELDSVTKGEKQDIITFSNSLYHIITHPVGGMRLLNKNAENTLKQVVGQLRNNLSDDGIFVFGEGESMQYFDNSFVYKVLQQNGFRHLTSVRSDINIWQKSQKGM